MATEHDQPPVSDADLELLLARGHVRDRRRERIIANVLRTVAQDERPRRLALWRISGLATAAAGAVALVVVAFRPGAPGDGGWRARGAGPSDVAEIGCSGGELSRCPAGSKLVWRAQLTGASGFLSAYAEPLVPGGDRIWYFAGADSPELSASDRPLPIARGIRIGREHAPGAYDIHVLVTRSRHAAPEIARGAADVIAAQTTRLVVVP